MKRILSVFLFSTLVITSIGFTGCEKKDKLSSNNNDKIQSIVLPKEKDNSISLDLYFDGSTTKDKAAVVKEERLINKEEVIGEIIMQEFLKGPSNVSMLKPVLPKETKLLSFSIKDKVAYVNLSKEANFNMTPVKEEACLRGILNSLTQLPSVSKVKILVENKDIESLGGNYNISKPFGKDDIENILLKK
ncbi:GerMN domain-containing protein [Candidatus Clostridium radicumherbarum]|jgi:Spore germination protein|uniref:GerMN domain-containing protein n=1 Tax=Candidatus Clostridium radicumherbarum TaxID=3381662 RepID=A0ABW8U2G5_9CLOT